MKNIHLLPTDKSSRLHTWVNDKGLRATLYEQPQLDISSANIYITNDEQPKYKDYYTIDGKEIYYCNTLNPIRNNHYKKIILTTDQDLIKDGVQAIDNEFLEWFLKNPSCESVEVYKHKGINFKKMGIPYKIIIPKEETFKHKVEVLPKEEILENRSHAYDFIDFDEIEKQIAITETRGEKVVKYLDKYKGQSIYNDIALAIEFGYQLKLEEDE
jgi:hypothetical protein